MGLTVSPALGFPCPSCNPDGNDADPMKRVRTTLETLLAGHASCAHCGLQFSVNREKSGLALSAATELQKAVRTVSEARHRPIE